MIRGIAAGDYGLRGIKNAMYARRARMLLQPYPELADDKVSLWRRACVSTTKAHNGQMDVVVALWRSGVLE
jgi:hypothetical protein